MREDPEQAGCSTPAPSSASSSRSTTARSWQSLQQNLPATPVTDLRVHRGDLVISTMGRAFWVMDDVSPLRQMAAAKMSTTPTLLQPASRVRYRAAGGGRRGGGPSIRQTAIAIDYLLPEGFTGPVALEITDAKGRVVRTVSPAAAAVAVAARAGPWRRADGER